MFDELRDALRELLVGLERLATEGSPDDMRAACRFLLNMIDMFDGVGDAPFMSREVEVFMAGALGLPPPGSSLQAEEKP
jgi:hypothetical protein